MKLIKLSAIESTNDYLKDLSSDKHTADGTVIWTEEQTHGRGQMGSSWYSEPGKSLIFSVLKRFDRLYSDSSFAISMAVALAIAETLDGYEVPLVSIKWPNDIMSANEKLGGILIENQLRKGMIASSVIGVGVNIEDFDTPPGIRSVSMQRITGKAYKLEDLVREFSSNIFTALSNVTSEGMDALKEEYHRRMFGRNKVLTFETAENGLFSGIIKGVDDNGLLRIETETGSRTFDLKQIRFKL